MGNQALSKLFDGLKDSIEGRLRGDSPNSQEVIESWGIIFAEIWDSAFHHELFGERLSINLEWLDDAVRRLAQFSNDPEMARLRGSLEALGSALSRAKAMAEEWIQEIDQALVSESSIVKSVIKVLADHPGEYMRQGQVHQMMKSMEKNIPSAARVGQVLRELHDKGLVNRKAGKAQGRPETAFYSLSEAGFTIAREYKLLPSSDPAGPKDSPNSSPAPTRGKGSVLRENRPEQSIAKNHRGQQIFG